MNKSEYGAGLLNEEENVRIMLNEEDHLRIQCMTPGWRLFDALEAALQIDGYVDEKLSYAFDKEFGYLTSWVTNIGT
ncbi:ATP--guanido phosphotransferase, partial [Listeria monocytogenes]|nr:ATP--guanido phosphotransferase [Listeria monocytogenes]